MTWLVDFCIWMLALYGILSSLRWLIFGNNIFSRVIGLISLVVTVVAILGITHVWQ